MSEWKETEFGLVPSDWDDLTIGDLVESKILEKPMDGNHGNIHPKGSDFVTHGIPFIMASDIKNGKIDLTNCSFISKELAQTLQKGFSLEGDVLLTHKASLGRTAIVGKLDTPFIMLTPQVTYYRVKDPNKLDNYYLKYFFNSPIFQAILENHGNSGSTRSYIGITAQRELPILLPPIEMQIAISTTLKSLDDKIDLLQHQNATLEKMAESIFRQWFVENAKEDWEEATLQQHTDVFRGLSYKGSGLAGIGNGLPMHNLNSVNEGGGYKYEGIKFYKGEYKERHIIYPGEIIVTNTEQGHEFRLIGYPAIVPNSFGNKGLFSQHIFKLIIKNDSYLSRQFIYYLLMTPNVREQIIAATNGSTVNMLAIDGLQRPEFKLPPQSLVKEFTEIVSVYWEKKDINRKQIHTLATLRDTLLPKLMNGEVKVQTN